MTGEQGDRVPVRAKDVETTTAKKPWIRRLGRAGAALALGVVAALLAVWGYRWSQTRPLLVKPAEFPLEEVSLFEAVPRSGGGSFLYRGHCEYALSGSEARDPDVKYPDLVSQRPLYGALFDDTPDDPAELDEETKPEEAEEKSVFPIHYVIDESGGTGSGYDRLYLDLDRNSDLTDEKPLRIWLEHPPFPERMVTEGCVVFEPFRTERLSRPGAGNESDTGNSAATQPPTVELTPRLEIPEFLLDTPPSPQGRKSVWGYVFFVPTTARRGTVHLGRSLYDFWCARDQFLTGWYHSDDTTVLARRRDRWPSDGWEGIGFSSWNYVDGRDYSLSITPEGDRLRITPYDGPYGTFAIVLDGARHLSELQVDAWWACDGLNVGSQGRDCAVSLGERARWSCRIPTGDYTCRAYLTLLAEGVTLRLSPNLPLQPDEQEPNQPKAEPFSASVRPNETSLWNLPVLTSKPTVHFNLFPRKPVFRTGETISIVPLIGFPKIGYELNRISGASSSPTLTIRDANGVSVASEKLEFG